MKRQSRISRRIDVKGPAAGYCNICGEFAKLTQDHIPPKSCRGVTRSEIHQLHSKFSDSPTLPTPQRFQAGPYFRTLCERCNGLLGREYDPALAEFSRQVRALVHTRLQLPDRMQILIRPQRVLRCVLGHIAAHGLNGFKNEAPITLPLKDYILDPTNPLPDTIHVYYWVYPFSAQVLLKWAGMLRLDGTPPLTFSLLKFFPLAFLMTIQEETGQRFSLPTLDTFRKASIDSQHEVILPLRPLPHRLWPENPDDDGIIMYHDDYAHLVKPLTRLIPT